MHSLYSGWGHYPEAYSHLICPKDEKALISWLQKSKTMIPRGLGRSYGDSSLGENLLSLSSFNRFLNLFEEEGILEAEAGISLFEILQCIVPKGWFLPVTPGTSFVSLGGAIASDVHGKNHHKDGGFGAHVLSLILRFPNGEKLLCSPKENHELFFATLGGMGLTGIIESATISLIPIESPFIHQTLLKTQNLEETLTLLDEHEKVPYSVAWIDCLSKGDSMGRSLLMLGRHANTEESEGIKEPRSWKASVPFKTPSWLLNSWSMKAFNTIYYNKTRSKMSESVVHYSPYFHPLDALMHWNRLYGKKGFLQYQFVLPKEAGTDALKALLEQISSSQKGSFLAVLKTLGEEGKGALSFPMKGYTLALDFKYDDALPSLFKTWTEEVHRLGGRLYLAKDALMSEEHFKIGYPKWKTLHELRKTYSLRNIQSLQSNRLGIDRL